MNGNVINWSFHSYASQRTHLKGISSMILSSVYMEKTCPRLKGHSPTPSYLGQAILFLHPYKTLHDKQTLPGSARKFLCHLAGSPDFGENLRLIFSYICFSYYYLILRGCENQMLRTSRNTDPLTHNWKYLSFFEFKLAEFFVCYLI